MKESNRKAARLGLAAVTAALGMGLTGVAHAEAYGIAYNNVFGFQVLPSDAGAFFMFPNTVVSRADATLSGSAPCSNSASGFLADAAPCNLGAVAKANNDFTPQGNLAGNFSRSDSQVVSEQVDGVTFAKAVAISESRVGGTALATAGSSIASDTNFVIDFTVSGATTLTFDFDADPYLLVTLLNGTFPPSVARAALDASISIQRLSDGATVFNWAPNGGAGGITGGTELADEASLNLQITRNFASNGTTLYDPTADASVGADTGAGSDPGIFKNYTAVTDILAGGDYILTLRFGSRTEVELVPEPATLALLGVSLLGLGLIRRRRGA